MNATFVNLSNIIEVQQEYVDKVVENTNQSHDATRSGLNQLIQAEKRQAGCVLS